jgi:prepilin-type N-terminal cleavage/methylation domain-containing protein/prepilin-type processing-associated H-X9-DG protein
MMSPEHSRRGFTLVELLVVILIISVLIALLLPALARAREAARAVQCADHLRNINLAVFQYSNLSGGELPATSYNVYRCLGPSIGDSSEKDMGGNHWRCPSDRLIPGSFMPYWYSYVVAADRQLRDDIYTCFNRQADTSNRLENISPGTISWIEAWSPCMIATTAGNSDYTDSQGTPVAQYVTNLRCLDLDWRDNATGWTLQTGPTADPKVPGDRGSTADKYTDVALYDVLAQYPRIFGGAGYNPETSWLPTIGSKGGNWYVVSAAGPPYPGQDWPDSVGNYNFMWGYCLKFGGSPNRLADVFHRGRANVAFIDGHVETLWLRGIVSGGFAKPINDSRWTREAD